MTDTKRAKIGLALGSGGARGLTHIGVIKVLEENNIPIDIIAGSSIGALIGGVYAMNRDIGQLEKKAIAADWKFIMSLIDPTLQEGFLGGDKVKKFIESYTGEAGFDDLKIPLSVIATDMETGEAVVINSGKVAEAIRASISIPLVFKPITLNNRLLADGGMSLPVPVSVAKKMGADIIIAVNLDGDCFTYKSSGKTKLSLSKIARNSVNIMRYHLASSNVIDADIVISPKIGNVEILEFLEGEKAIKSGEEATKLILPRLKELL